jgi:hypothetical protein
VTRKYHWLLAGLAIALIRCGGDSVGPAAGEERGNCYPNGTCNAGLSCFSNKCVRYDRGIGGSDASATTGSAGIIGGGKTGGAGATGGAGGTEAGASSTGGAAVISATGGAAGTGGTAATGGGGIGGMSGQGGADDGGDTAKDASVTDGPCVDTGAAPDAITVPSCGQPGAPTREAYNGTVTIGVSGIIRNAPDLSYDAFYELNPRDFTQATTPSPERLVYNRVSEGSCVCPSECPTTSHTVASVLVGNYPAFNPSHTYTVSMDLGASSDRLNFAFGDCGCYDNAGSYSLTISAQGGSACGK